MPVNVLAISSSRVGNSAYLEKAVPAIREFLGDTALNIAFIPFAAASGDYHSYLQMVVHGLQQLPHRIKLAEPHNAAEVIQAADVIMVGGGNTFKLLHDIYAHNVFDLVKQKVLNGTPYIGWSAGANITGSTICTTNDMPIIEPESFTAFGFFPFQLNPHYINMVTEGHNGETRDQRLEEYVMVNKDVLVVGLPEGTALLQRSGSYTFEGLKSGVYFFNKSRKPGPYKHALDIGTDVSNLFKQLQEF